MKTGKYIRKYGLIASGILLGAAAGFAYWHFVGCTSGTCAITSNPLNSSLYGAMMGGLFLSMFKSNKAKEV